MGRRGHHGEPGVEPIDGAPARSAGPPRAWAVRAATLGLWAVMGLAAVAGVAGLATRAAPATARPVEAPPPSVGAEGFAEVFVATYLSAAGDGREEALAPFYPPERVDLNDVEAASLYVSRTATLGAEQISKGYWSVTVAAEVLETRPDGSYQPAGTRFYVVGVLEQGGAYVATSLPGQVAAPPTTELPKLAVGTFGHPDDGDPTSDTIARFFAALLAGQGELERYMAPGARLRPVEPSPYASVSVERVAFKATAKAKNDGARTAQVEVAAVDRVGRTQVFHYALELAVRAGRWEVTQLLPAIPLGR